MTDKVNRFLQFHLNKENLKYRTTTVYPDNAKLNSAEILRLFYEREKPILFPEDIFGFNRTISNIATDKMCMTNFIADFSWALKNGFNKIREELVSLLENATNKEFYKDAITSIDLTLEFVIKYREEAKKQNNDNLYSALEVVPFNQPNDYYQALVFMKILIFSLRASGADHVTLGRFDQYLLPYFNKSLEKGVKKEELLEQTELFFISINFDTDLYRGIQRGDNGQSLVIGGLTTDNTEGFNALSDVVLQSSLELTLIDPKINLRVNKDTPLEIYVKATELTKKGLGFPQYCNDDVIIPALLKLGYDKEDAINYSIAACWEVITLNSHDIVNLRCMNFPQAVRTATVEKLKECNSFEEYMTAVEDSVIKMVEEKIRLSNQDHDWFAYGNAFGSIFIENCRLTGKTTNQMGAKYNNFGIHGLGIAPAVDAVAGVYQCVFTDKSITKDELIDALESNFTNKENIRKLLLPAPKMGNNDKITNEIANRILSVYSKHLNGVPNSVGGVFRAGTGGPHFYVWLAKEVGATSDGRLAGDPFPASFSPSIGVKTDGPLSVIKTFSNFDMTNVCNGGPLTMEIHDNVFRNQMGINKVASLVSSFIKLGGHQLQINAICREKLLDAQKHPEKYPDLIVRVWGWSGYFNELDVCFQNHVISRLHYQF